MSPLWGQMLSSPWDGGVSLLQGWSEGIPLLPDPLEPSRISGLEPVSPSARDRSSPFGAVHPRSINQSLWKEKSQALSRSLFPNPPFGHVTPSPGFASLLLSRGQPKIGTWNRTGESCTWNETRILAGMWEVSPAQQAGLSPDPFPSLSVFSCCRFFLFL